MERSRQIVAISTQGRPHNYNEWMTSYEVHYKVEPSQDFTAVKDNQNLKKVSRKN